MLLLLLHENCVYMEMYIKVVTQPSFLRLPMKPQPNLFGNASCVASSGLIKGGLGAYGEKILGSSSGYVHINVRPVLAFWMSIISSCKHSNPLFPGTPWIIRNFSHGTVSLVISQGKLKFDIREVDPPKKEKWKSKKRLKMQRRREKQLRKAASKRDPRRLTVKKKKKKFANVEDRIKDKLERARMKEASLIERLKHYEIAKANGPEAEPLPHELTSEERFYLKKMAQKRSNYVPVGVRGVFGGVILNMHLHWKKHETVEVICKRCKPGQVHEYAREIARLSGGIPIQIIGHDTIIFYRGKNYAQPDVMSPVDTLSRKRALEKSRYEQSLESVRHEIAIAEKELQIYRQHLSLYHNEDDGGNSLSGLDNPNK